MEEICHNITMNQNKTDSQKSHFNKNKMPENMLIKIQKKRSPKIQKKRSPKIQKKRSNWSPIRRGGRKQA